MRASRVPRSRRSTPIFVSGFVNETRRDAPRRGRRARSTETGANPSERDSHADSVAKSAASGASCPPSSGWRRTGGAFVDRRDRGGTRRAKYVRDPGISAAFALVTALRGGSVKSSAVTQRAQIPDAPEQPVLDVRNRPDSYRPRRAERRFAMAGPSAG